MGKFSTVPYRFLIVLVLLSPGSTSAAEYVALVIGVDSYREYELKTPANNAKALASSFEILNFDVQISINRPHYELQDTVDAFAKLSAGAEVSVLYYSGHTIKLGGNQYLIPADVDLRSRADIRKLIDVQQLLNKLKKANTVVVLLDGCAESGFARGWGDTFGRTSVCADEASQLSLSPGVSLSVSRSTATTPFLGGTLDGLNLYSEALVSSVNADDTIAEILGAVHARVEQNSGGGEKSVLLGNENQTSRLLALSIRPAQTNRLIEDTNLNADGSNISPGLYQVENLRVNRSLTILDGILTLSKLSNDNRADDWLLESTAGPAFSLRNRNTGQFLVANEGISQASLANNLNDDAGTWKISPVEFGSPGEQTIESAERGGYLTADGSSLELRGSGASSASGWILRRLAGLAEIEIIPTPSTIASLPQSTASLAAGVNDLPADSDESLSENLKDHGVIKSELTTAQVEAAHSTFRRLKELLQKKQIAEVEALVHPGYSLDAFVHMMLGYSELGIQLGEVSKLEDSVYVDLMFRALELEGSWMTPSRELRRARLVVKKIGQTQWSPIYARHCGTKCDSVPQILSLAQSK